MTLRSHLLFWTGIFILFWACVWLLKGMLLPFVTGLVVAYLLNPVVQRLARRGWSRARASGLILILFLISLVISLTLIIPVMVREGALLISLLPDLTLRAQEILTDYFPAARGIVEHLHLNDLPGLAQSYSGQILNVSSGLAAGLLGGSGQAVSFIAVIALMPVVAFYMMVQWPDIVTWIDQLLPRSQAQTVRTLIGRIDTRISAFVRGQLLVCLILAVYYALGLSLVGLNYGVFIGLLAGLLSIIPFVGSAFGLIASVLVALFQVSADGWGILIAALSVFAIGQFFEGNFITPRIVGKSVGLHPLWIIFALMAGGSLLGLVGMLLAVPVAVVVAVLVEFALDRYRNSAYYKGLGNIKK